jgi:hypothetical protein
MAQQSAFSQLDEMGADGVVFTHDCEPFKAALRDAKVPPAPSALCGTTARVAGLMLRSATTLRAYNAAAPTMPPVSRAEEGIHQRAQGCRARPFQVSPGRSPTGSVFPARVRYQPLEPRVLPLEVLQRLACSGFSPLSLLKTPKYRVVAWLSSGCPSFIVKATNW